MKHFLAYGNSDQVSFRDDEVRLALDYMTVPGTIAAYYPDATAAFVLSSRLPYIIDPRTPLFQGTILKPKASHIALACHMGGHVQEMVGDGTHPLRFSPAVYSRPVIEAATAAMVVMQREYGRRGENISDKLDHYRGLLAEATGESLAPESAERRPPSFVLAPYFAARDAADPWWKRNQWIWESGLQLPNPEEICPVVAVGDAASLPAGFQAIPEGLSTTTFFWVTGFDERRASTRDLIHLRNGVKAGSSRRLVNLYGSFFSMCLAPFGLWGFNNGLGYSESRSWPELTSTGAAPARYYIPKLHMYLPPATARLVVERDDTFACSCTICAGRPASAIPGFEYQELKKHFVLARRWELDVVGERDVSDIAADLKEAFTNFTANVEPRLPTRIRIDCSFLLRWADALLEPATAGE